MRHRKRGRVLGRNPSHRKALFQNLVKALILTADPDADGVGAPKVKGRIITTLEKAKEVRSLVEKCITIARKGILAEVEALKFETDAERGSEQWQTWRKGAEWQKWAAARAPAVTARRRVEQMLRVRGDVHSKGDKRELRILFEVLAPRFADRNGGYTRVLRLAKPRLGDAGTRAILEFVGVNDRTIERATAPSIEGTPSKETAGAT